VQTDSFSNVLKTRLRPRLHKEKRLRDGVVDSHRLGRLLERFVPEWPKSYWTIAMAGDAMLLFTADGVFEYRGGRKRQISGTPAPVGLAIRASCAVPGVIESVRFAGRELFDGALGPYGGCPTRMVKRHFGATARDIAAVDLVKSASSRQDRFLMLLGRAISGTLKYRPRHNQEPPVEAGLLVQPEVNGFPSLEFELTREQKQEAVLAGFRAAVKSLEQAGMLKGKKLEQSRLASESFAELERLCLSSVPRQRRSGESFWQRLVRKVLRRR
jgi:predicted acylesterase/phospholipase RssA